MHYFYVLLLRDNSLYKGTTANLKRRFKEHQLGKVDSTRNKRPLRLIHYEGYLLKSDALRREKFLKTTEGRRLIRQQLRDILRKIDKGSGVIRPPARSNDLATPITRSTTKLCFLKIIWYY